MKRINIFIATIFLCVCASNFLKAEVSEDHGKLMQTIDLAEQIYNRLVISERIITYTNEYIDTKKQEKPEVPDDIWLIVKDSIDYNTFKVSAIQILKDNLTLIEMQELLNDFENKPFIPIPTLIIKKELYESMPIFYKSVDNNIKDVLIANGF